MAGPPLSSAPDLERGLTALVEAALGTRVEIRGLKRLTGGTSHESWAFDAIETEGGRARSLILRRDFAAEALDLPIGIEFALLQRLYNAGLSVPEPVASGGAESPIATPFTLSARLGGGDVRKAMARKAIAPAIAGAALVDLQAQIHRLDYHAIADGLLPDDGANTAARLVDHWANIALAFKRGTDPLLAAAIDWLRAAAPRATPLCLVHGDFKTNNLVMGDDGRFAVIDWELSHVGDPLEDVAWTMLWTTPHDLVGGMLSAEDYLAAYRRASGHAIDPSRLAFWQLFVLMKLIAIFHRSMQLHGGAELDNPTHIMLGRALPWVHRQIAAHLTKAVAGGD